MPRKRKTQPVDQENKEAEAPVEVLARKAEKSEKPLKKIKLEPEWMIGESLNVIKVILSVQKSDCNSNKCVTELQKIYKKMESKAFMTVLMQTIRLFLNRDDGDEIATRVLRFIGTFIASFGEDVTESGSSHPVVETAFKELLSFTSNLTHIRVRLCLLIANIMNSFSQTAEIDEAIIELIIERMLYFMRDVSPLVRAQAVLALQRLQDPDNVNEDPVTKSYIYHMESDPAPKVRQAVLTAIAKKIANLPSIIDRFHDVDEKVRRHAYLQISSYPVKSYRIADRISILNAGLNDRSDTVKKVVTNVLLCNWIGVYDYDYAEFIKAIKLDSNEKELQKFRKLSEMALSDALSKRKLSDVISYLTSSFNPDMKNCLTIEKSSLEMLIVWKMITKYHQEYIEGKRKDDAGFNQEDDDEEEHDKSAQNDTLINIDLIPELSNFCDYMEKFVSEFKFTGDVDAKYQRIYFSQCIVVLLEIAQLNDLGDEVGKERLTSLLKKILLDYDLTEYAIKEISSLIEKLISKVEDRLTFFNQIVNQMIKSSGSSEYSRQKIIDDLITKADMDIKLKANNIKLKMMDLKEQETNFVERKQYAECQKVSEEYAKLNEQLIELLKNVASAESKQSLDNLSLVANVKRITPAEVLKNLKICYFAIKTKGVKAITHEILQIYNEFVRYHLESSDVSTRIWALKTATAYSLLYESIAKEIYLTLKSQVFKSTHTLVWECSIQCIIDLLLRYTVEKMDCFDSNDMSVNASAQQNRSKRGGRTLYTDVETDDDDVVDELSIVKTLDIMQMLTHLIEQSVDKKIFIVTITGICKLILHGIYCTREIMSKFLLMYFNPATDAEISQILGIFLENIIKRKKQEYLHDALVPTIITLLEAPYDSPLREVKLETVLKYVIEATRPVFCSNGLNLHNTLSMKFFEVMRDNSESKEVLKIFSKELLDLEISDDPLLRKDIIKQIEIVLKETSVDVRTKKYLTDFESILNGTYRAPLKFSSSARVTNNVEDEEQLEDIGEENEDGENEQNVAVEKKGEEKKDNVATEEQMKELSKSILSLTPSKVRPEGSMILSPSKVNTPSRIVARRTIFNFTSSKVVDLPEQSILNETKEEDVIPASQPHAEIDSTTVEHFDIPATQKIPESPENATLHSTIECSVIITPLTVKPAKKTKPRHEELPPTPPSFSRPRRSAVLNAKRHLEVSSPKTPSVVSPMRKSVKKTDETSKTPKLSSSLTTIKASTPISGSWKTRQQMKQDIAKNITLTRSASRSLNVEVQEVKKNTKVTKPSKLPVKKKADEKKEIPKMNTRGGTRAASGKGNSSRPPWR